MKWFGPASAGVSAEDAADHVPTPIGTTCSRCSEPIEGADRGFLSPAPIHRECLLRSIIGGANHLKGNCTCSSCSRYGGQPPDPPGLTMREAALLATKIYEEQQARLGRFP